MFSPRSLAAIILLLAAAPSLRAADHPLLVDPIIPPEIVQQLARGYSARTIAQHELASRAFLEAIRASKPRGLPRHVVGEMAYELATALNASGRAAAARKVHLRAAQILDEAERATEGDTQERIRDLRLKNRIGSAQACEALSLFEEAETLYREVIQTVEARLQADPDLGVMAGPVLAAYLDDFGRFYRAWGKSELGESYAARARELRKPAVHVRKKSRRTRPRGLASSRGAAGRPTPAAGTSVAAAP